MKRRQDERGAVAIMSALLMTVVLTFTAFAVDIGTQRVARSDMQALADVVAMDLARQLKGRTAAAILADPRFAEVRDQALAQNTTTTGATPDVTTVLGTVDPSTGAFTAVSGGAVPTAVRVIAATSVGFGFAPGRGGAARDSIASRGEATACFSVSPNALTLDSSGSALGPVLDRILRVNLGVVGPDGLLALRDVAVPLADIAVELGVGTPDALVGLSNVSLREFSLASARALSKNGFTAEATALEAIGTQISGAYLDVGRILNLQTGGAAAGMNAEIDVFDLVTGAIIAANGANAISIPALNLGIPLVGVTQLEATIIEPPQIACGGVGSTARSAQVRMRLNSTLDPGSIGATDTSVSLDLDLARGEGTLTSLVCGPPTAAVITARSGLASLTGTLRFRVARLLVGLLAVETSITGSGGQGGPTDLTFNPPDDGSAIPPQSISGSSVLNLQVGTTTARLLGVPVPLLGLVSDLVLPLVNGPVNALLSAVLYPVLGALGIQLGRTEIAMNGEIDCETVRLVG